MNIVIIGAGPAGIAAAAAAARHSSNVILIDDNPSVGGQIWRGSGDPSNRLAQTSVTILTGARAVSADSQRLLLEKNGKAEHLLYTKLILATGARELFLPFPGWTLPNILGVGGLQALVKSGLPVAGKRIIVSGSGPLLLAVASYLKSKGAIVPLIAEQASLSKLATFTASLLAHPSKLFQAAQLRPNRYLTGCWVESAQGGDQLQSVLLRQGERVWNEPCDYLANAYGFVPNTELAALLGCALENGVVKVDNSQQTSVPNIYCAGEAAGLGGVDTATIEGEIAGLSVVSQPIPANLRRQHARAKSFAKNLNAAFQPRQERRTLAQPDTIICRCEDVPLARLSALPAASWRTAKLHERCGMGPCQGRICGPATQFILGWEPSSVRPPIFPTHLDTLIQEHISK